MLQIFSFIWPIDTLSAEMMRPVQEKHFVDPTIFSYLDRIHFLDFWVISFLFKVAECICYVWTLPTRMQRSWKFVLLRLVLVSFVVLPLYVKVKRKWKLKEIYRIDLYCEKGQKILQTDLDHLKCTFGVSSRWENLSHFAQMISFLSTDKEINFLFFICKNRCK